jgi:hypothetical protein
MARMMPGGSLFTKLAGLAAAVVAVAVLLVVLSAVNLLPRLHNPFSETTTVRSGPAVLKSISALSRYEAASGSFQVVVDLTKKSFLPSFLQGSQTLFVGQGSDIAYVDFSGLKGSAIRVSADRSAVTINLPSARLEPAVLNVRQSYVFAQQQGLLNRIGNVFGGNPNSEQQVYIVAQQKISTAARSSSLLSDATRNTQAALTAMLRGLGFQHVTIHFAG